MKITLDTNANTFDVVDTNGTKSYELYSKEAFEVLSRVWMKTSWNQKYSYTFSWFGRPVIQHPEDMIRLQEVIYDQKPDIIVETGVAHGGSLIYYASLLKAMGNNGRVIGVDIEIRDHNRKAIEDHELSSMITLIEGDSVADEILDQVRQHIKPTDKVLVLLDSDHSKGHVLRELEAYHSLVTPGSYIVATDGLMQDLYDVPRGQANWKDDNPAAAAEEFAAKNPAFTIEQPAWKFNESALNQNITAWPSAWLKKAA